MTRLYVDATGMRKMTPVEAVRIRLLFEMGPIGPCEADALPAADTCGWNTPWRCRCCGRPVCTSDQLAHRCGARP